MTPNITLNRSIAPLRGRAPGQRARSASRAGNVRFDMKGRVASDYLLQRGKLRTPAAQLFAAPSVRLLTVARGA